MVYDSKNVTVYQNLCVGCVGKCIHPVIPAAQDRLRRDLSESSHFDGRRSQTMEKRVLLIYNPRAGKGQFLAQLHEVIDILVKDGWTVEVYPTQGPGDAVIKTSSLGEGYDMLIPAGGDGTLDEVVTGMLRAGRDIPIGYIPVGSTNDYAASLGIPFQTGDAVRMILSGKPVRLDAGIVNREHIFIYVAAFGAFTDVAYTTDQHLKNTIGHAAYIVEALKSIGNMKPYHAVVEANGRTRENDYILGMVTNSTSVGGIRNMLGPDVALDDGLFEVTLVQNPKNLLEMQEILTALLTQNFNTGLVEYFKTDHLVMTSEEEIPWTFDGEYGGAYQSLDLENRKQTIRIIRGEAKKAELISIQ